MIGNPNGVTLPNLDGATTPTASMPPLRGSHVRCCRTIRGFAPTATECHPFGVPTFVVAVLSVGLHPRLPNATPSGFSRSLLPYAPWVCTHGYRMSLLWGFVANLPSPIAAPSSYVDCGAFVDCLPKLFLKHSASAPSPNRITQPPASHLIPTTPHTVPHTPPIGLHHPRCDRQTPKPRRPNDTTRFAKETDR